MKPIALPRSRRWVSLLSDIVRAASKTGFIAARPYYSRRNSAHSRLTLLRACELASLGKLVTFDFAGALPIGNFSRPLRVVSEGGAAAQTGYNDQTKSKCLH
jgi:hypothetical protein